MSKYLSVAETAKLVRGALKEAFPDIKFSVVSKSYSMGASISVRYTDGPNTAQVEAITSKFEGSYFDGMQDYKGNLRNMVDGEMVSFGADFIFVNRDFSDSFIQKSIDALYRKYAGNFAQSDAPKATVEDYRQGRTWGFTIPGINFNTDFFRTELNSIMSKRSDRLAVGESKIAGKVIFLGNDGYSQVGALTAVQ